MLFYRFIGVVGEGDPVAGSWIHPDIGKGFRSEIDSDRKCFQCDRIDLHPGRNPAVVDAVIARIGPVAVWIDLAGELHFHGIEVAEIPEIARFDRNFDQLQLFAADFNFFSGVVFGETGICPVELGSNIRSPVRGFFKRCQQIDRWIRRKRNADVDQTMTNFKMTENL